MAEAGGYDPETTNPFDPHGDDHNDEDDDENIPLLPFSKGKPSFKHPTGTSTPYNILQLVHTTILHSLTQIQLVVDYILRKFSMTLLLNR